MRRELMAMGAALAMVACGGPDDDLDYSDTAMGATEQPNIQEGTEAGAADVGGWSPANMLAHIATGDSLEVEIARMARDRAASEEVKEVAQTLVRDHSANRDEALRLASQEQLTLIAPPADTSAAHAESVMQQLEALQGEAFDRAFVQRQIEHHQDEVRKLSTMQATAQDPEVREFLDRTLTAVQDHLDQLQQIPIVAQ